MRNSRTAKPNDTKVGHFCKLSKCPSSVNVSLRAQYQHDSRSIDLISISVNYRLHGPVFELQWRPIEIG